jgi:ABC-type antimicrobial peptide transport system permease subunit
LLRGSLLSRNDIDSARHAVVVNETFVREHFGNEYPIGQKIRFGDFETLSDWPHDAYFEIIGIIADAKNNGLQESPKSEVYLPATLTGDGPRGLIFRSTVNPNSILESVLRDIAAVDPNLVLADSGTIESLLKHSYFAGPQFILVTLGAIAIMGVLLILIGIFSVMAYTVSLQTHEIGIRIALGAQQANILKMILAKGMRLVAAGIMIGLFASYGLMRFLASQIWGVSVTDPWTFAAVVIMISIVGLIACVLPARAAAKVDPLVAIRYE